MTLSFRFPRVAVADCRHSISSCKAQAFCSNERASPADGAASQMIELFGSALVTFLVIIDPPGCAPIFASLTRGTPAAHARAMAIKSSLIAWAILMFFALLGRPMLHALGAI